MLLVNTAGDDRALPAEQNDDITDAYYVSSNDVCVASPQLRDAALALMSLQSPPLQGKQFFNTSYYNICILKIDVLKKYTIK